MTTVSGASYLAQNKENLLAFSINNAQLWPNKFFFYFYILQIFRPTALRDNTWILKGWEGGSLIFKKNA